VCTGTYGSIKMRLRHAGILFTYQYQYMFRHPAVKYQYWYVQVLAKTLSIPVPAGTGVSEGRYQYLSAVQASARRVGLSRLWDWILSVMALSLVPWR